uniref:Uncharacterized protein n=1 Tax=Caenorhabditis japonica TaxID=281687 RepID=A0A8R1ID38_CAEJA
MFEEIDETEADRSKQLAPEENEEEEKDRRERLAYGMHVGSVSGFFGIMCTRTRFANDTPMFRNFSTVPQYSLRDLSDKLRNVGASFANLVREHIINVEKNDTLFKFMSVF